MDYRSHWGLAESPFQSAVDPRYFHPSPTHDEALARLKYLVEHRRRLGLLSGAAGAGKSVLLNLLGRELARQGCAVAALNLTGISSDEFLWRLAAQLGSKPKADDAAFVLWRRISDRIAENGYQNLATVLLLDDADQCDDSVLNYVRRLLSDDGRANSTTVVLGVNSLTAHQIGARLLDQVDLRVELEPWTVDETADFLASSVQKAGRADPAFDREAAARIQQLAQGSPRRVSRLAELSLLAGASLQIPRIDEQTVESVFQELVASPP